MSLFIQSFAAGVLSFLAPCVWPLIPGYLLLALSVSSRNDAHREALLHALCFVTGFSLMFSLLGAFASGLGSPWGPYLPVLRRAAGILTMAFGLVLIGWPAVNLREPVVPVRYGVHLTRGISFMMGAALACDWIPCVGELLGSVLALASNAETRWHGMALVLTYAIGMGIPFILAGLSVNLLLRVLRPHPRIVRGGGILAGMLLMFFGWLVFKNNLTLLLRFLPVGHAI